MGEAKEHRGRWWKGCGTLKTENRDVAKEHRGQVVEPVNLQSEERILNIENSRGVAREDAIRTGQVVKL
jgi:hypothetical protein